MKKKRSILCLLLAAIILSTTACGSSGGSSASSAGNRSSAAEPVELTLSMGTGNSQEYNDFFKNGIVKTFEDAHPGITINLTLTNDPTGLAKQQLAAGGGPDLICVEPTTLQLFASAGYLVPLDSYVGKYEWDKKFAKWATDTVTRDGKLMGLPGAIDALFVYYNKTMFEQNGWKVPTNYEELTALCEAMKSKDIIPFAFGNSDFKQANEWWLSMGYNEAMGQEDFRKVLQGEIPWNGPQMKEATQKIANMWQKGYIYEKSAGITGDDSRSLFVTGKAGMLMSGQWDAGQIEEASPEFEWDVFKMPSWNPNTEAVLPVALGNTFSINSHCANPDAAAEFLDWVFNDNSMTGMIKLGSLYPTTNSKLDSVAGLDPHDMTIAKMIQSSMTNGKIGYCAWTYWPANADTYAWNNLEALYLKQISVDEYVNNLQNSYKMDVEKGNVLKF